MKKPRRRSQTKKTALRPTGKPWMSVLACMAAESRLDGGAGLHMLLQYAKFDVRPHLSLQKHAA